MGIMHKNSQVGGLAGPATSTETVIYTTPVVSIGPTGPPANPIDISGTVTITPGTGATGITIRCRQGAINGAQVGGSGIAVAATAGAAQAISFGFTDTTTFLEQVNGGAYVITATQTGAPSAGGSTNGIDIKVMT